MANDIQIANIALSRIGANSIESLTQATREARVCKIHYDLARDAALRDVDWSFARKQQALAVLSETVNGWALVYEYPADCLIARRIYNPGSEQEIDRVPFKKGINAAGTKTVLLCNQANAELIYTQAVTNAALFDVLFSDALAWRLAAELAVPLRADLELQKGVSRAYQVALGIAKAIDGNEGHDAPFPDVGSYVRARS